jgi:hypothetical protein
MVMKAARDRQCDQGRQNGEDTHLQPPTLTKLE